MERFFEDLQDLIFKAIEAGEDPFAIKGALAFASELVSSDMLADGEEEGEE